LFIVFIPIGQRIVAPKIIKYVKLAVKNGDAQGMLQAHGGANTVKALSALVDKIGPAVVMVHSQSGGYGLDLIRQRPDKVRAFIDYIVEAIGKEPYWESWRPKRPAKSRHTSAGKRA